MSSNILSLLSAFCLLSMSSPIYASNSDIDNLIIDNQEFTICLNRLSQTRPFANLKDVFIKYRPIEADPSVLESLNYQPEFDKEPWDYLASLVDEERIIDGINADQKYNNVLDRVESQYGVNRYDVLGVWGVESDFGTKLGKKDVIDSLATLSCFGRRQSYFSGEYVSALKILKQGDITKTDFKGSWAGAFGQTQFMPSTFLQLAQDFDGDNRKDLVNSQADALASTANFLKNSGYQSNQPWGYEVRLPLGIKALNNRKNKKPVSYWQGIGITLTDGSPLPHTLSSVGLFLPAGDKGPAFLVGRNFDAFYAYNASENYALAIAHLSNRIEKKIINVNFISTWPTDDPGLSRKESREVQESLNLLGYNAGIVDGIIGDGTRRVIQKYQSDMGIKIDGKAGKKLHQRLMTSSASLRETVKISTNTENYINKDSQQVNREESTRKDKFIYQNFAKYRKLFLVSFLLILLSAALFMLIKEKR